MPLFDQVAPFRFKNCNAIYLYGLWARPPVAPSVLTEGERKEPWAFIWSPGPRGAKGETDANRTAVGGQARILGGALDGPK